MNLAASLATLTINSASQGNKTLDMIQDYDVSDESKAEAIKAVGYKYPRAFKRTIGARTIGLTGTVVQGKPLVNWAKLLDLGEVFSLNLRYENGTAVQFAECMVSSYSYSGDAEGKNDYKLELIALQGKAL